MNMESLRFFATSMAIRFLLSDILLLTKPPCLLITVQITALSLSRGWLGC